MVWLLSSILQLDWLANITMAHMQHENVPFCSSCHSWKFTCYICSSTATHLQVTIIMNATFYASIQPVGRIRLCAISICFIVVNVLRVPLNRICLWACFTGNETLFGGSFMWMPTSTCGLCCLTRLIDSFGLCRLTAASLHQRCVTVLGW